jgi:hypothetical protein
MLHFVRYTCPAIMLPVIEGAFAANGYTVAPATHKSVSEMTSIVLQHGATTVLLMQPPNDAICTIVIWGPGERAAVTYLESLPLDLHQQLSLNSDIGADFHTQGQTSRVTWS